MNVYCYYTAEKGLDCPLFVTLFAYLSSDEVKEVMRGKQAIAFELHRTIEAY